MDKKKASKLASLVKDLEKLNKRISDVEKSHAEAGKMSYMGFMREHNQYYSFEIQANDEFVDGMDEFIKHVIFLYLNALYAKRASLEMEILSM